MAAEKPPTGETTPPSDAEVESKFSAMFNKVLDERETKVKAAAAAKAKEEADAAAKKPKPWSLWDSLFGG
jgi:hypothetical protein